MSMNMEPEKTYKIVRRTGAPSTFMSDGIRPRPEFDLIDSLRVVDKEYRELMKEYYSDIIGPLTYKLNEVTWKVPGSLGIFTYSNLKFVIKRMRSSKTLFPLRRLVRCEGYGRLPTPKKIGEAYIILNHYPKDWLKTWYQDDIYTAVKVVEIIEVDLE